MIATFDQDEQIAVKPHANATKLAGFLSFRQHRRKTERRAHKPSSTARIAFTMPRHPWIFWRILGRQFRGSRPTTTPACAGPTRSALCNLDALCNYKAHVRSRVVSYCYRTTCYFTILMGCVMKLRLLLLALLFAAPVQRAMAWAKMAIL